VVAPVQSYVERAPVAALGDLVRVVWIQRIGAEPYLQRNLPTGGIELQCPISSRPRLVGPLTGPSVEVLAPWVIVIGVRFRPGAAMPLLGLPACELVGLTVHLEEIWGPAVAVLGERLCTAGTPEAALVMLQEFLVARRADAAEPDPVVVEAVRRLMPWRTGGIGSLSSVLAISKSQLRRRCLEAVGIGPKALQRMLRFQRFLALVQSGGVPATPEGGGLAALAAEVGYADHAHLCRECVRLTGLPPRTFLGERAVSCGCGHDHSASFAPFLRGLPRLIPAPGLNARVLFKRRGARRA
jgi:AraC-like DNA-binding protein